MSTRRQLAAYREIQHARHEAHLLKTYGMLPVKARFVGKCGCARIFGDGSGWPTGTQCRFAQGSQIVKFRGAWWNLACVDRVRLDEWRAAAPFVREVQTREGWKAFDWTDDPNTAQIWRESYEFEPNERERVTERPR